MGIPNRVAERLCDGAPPLRISEFAAIIGFSGRVVRKFIAEGKIVTVSALGSWERRIPVSEARRIAIELKII